MPVYSVIVDVLAVRSYDVEADDASAAEALLRSDISMMSYDLIDEEIQNVTVEEE